ncbi:MAG: PASTA domain-containing protein [Phycisphaerae bacterium]|nr:PASTA domain-containing protein [Phycisphaerae bacterium]
MKRLLTTDKAKTIISSLVLCAMVTAAFVTPANAYDYKAKFIQEANWLTTQQVTSGGNLGGIVEGEDYTTVVETDNTQEAIWIWSRYAELTGDYTKYITNINNAWTYCLAFPAWTEGGTPTTPLPYYSTYNIGWGLLAEMKYRQVYLGRAEYVNHTSYGTSCANTLVSYTPGTSNATDALCLGIASGALYKYGVDVNSITYKNRAVVLGGSVRTWLGTTSNFAAESWAVSGGIAVWGVLNSYYQDPCNASGAAAWAETANTYMPLNAMNGSTNNYEYGMDGWYSWGHYALIQYRGADSFTKYNNVINKILDSDNDHDGGIRQGLTYADTSDYGWATDIPQFGVNYGLIGTTTYTVSGTITSGGSPLAGVLIRGLPGTNLTDANSWPVTDANGFYTTQVPAGFYGTVTPAKVGYSFSPANRTYSNLSSNQTAQNYTAATSTYVQLLDSWVTGTTHTKVTGTNRALVFVAHAKTSGVTLNTVTYGGQGMTKIIDKIIGSSSSRAYVAAFILKDANIVAATNTTFTPTWSGTAPTTVTYTSVLLQDVNQTTLTGASASNGLTTVYSVATTPIATSNGDMIIENAASSVVGTYLPTTGWTKDIDLSATGYDGMDAHRNAAGINETPAITQASANQSIIGFVVKAAPPSVTRKLTVSSSANGTVTTPGIGDFNYPDGTYASIVASASANYHFVNWTGSAVTAGKVASPNSPSTTVLMDANYTVQANFTIDQKSLTTSASSGGTVTTPGIGTYWYDYNSPASIVASANANYHFVNWTGSAVTAGKVASPNSLSTTVLMDANYAVQANFVKDQRSLLTSASGGGTVTTPGIGTYWYDYNTPASIVASNNANYHFVNWTGTAVTAGKVASPTSATTTVTMDANYTVQANFAIDQKSLLTSASSGGTVTTPGIGTYWYDYNSPAGIVASAVDPNYQFVNWTGTAVTAGKVANPTSPNTTVLMDANYTVQANFNPIVPDVVGMTQAAATTAITAIDNLTVGNVTQECSDTVAAGLVISQSPIGGTQVNIGSSVDIVVSLGLPIIPDVTGKAQAVAEANIVAATFTVGNVTTAYSDTVAVGNVISQLPIGGTAATSGTAVDIVVSLGLPIIPDVTGKAQAVAEANIVAATFTVGNVTTAYSDTVAAGNVISQLPIGGTAATSGTAVDLVVSNGPQPLQVRDDFNDNRRGAMWLVSVEQNAGITEDANRLNITAVGGQMDLVTPCIGHWKMNDNAANKTVLDSSDANHNGTAARDTNVLATTGKINGALIFNGTSDYIDVGNVIGTGAYTKVAWVKRADTNGTVYNNIISTGNTDYSHIFWAPSAYSFKLSAGNMNANRVQDPNSLAPDVWYQVAVTFDPNVSSGKMVLYKNGAQVASATSVPTQSSSPKTYIGRYASGYYFKGTIDNVMIFNKALTADEIAALYNTGSGTETMPASAGGSGEYSANGWSIDANENFQAKVDFHYITASGPAGWVAITIESNYDNYVSIIAGADGNLPYFEYEKVVDGNVTSAQASRGSNDGTLYISYDAALDELYLSYSDYGAGNAWQTITGLLAGQWYSESVRIAVGGGSAGDVIDNNQAYLDNFEVTSGLLIGWPPVTDIDGNGYIEWLDLEIMCENWLQTGSNVPGDIHKDEDNIVNFLDFADFTLAW